MFIITISFNNYKQDIVLKIKLPTPQPVTTNKPTNHRDSVGHRHYLYIYKLCNYKSGLMKYDKSGCLYTYLPMII